MGKVSDCILLIRTADYFKFYDEFAKNKILHILKDNEDNKEYFDNEEYVVIKFTTEYDSKELNTLISKVLCKFDLNYYRFIALSDDVYPYIDFGFLNPIGVTIEVRKTIFINDEVVDFF